MKFSSFLIVFVLLTLIGYSQKNKIYNSKDLSALKSLPVKWERYWNNHNMDSMGTMLRDNVDFITVGGTWLKGKEIAITDHKQKHQTIFKTSIWSTDSAVVKYVYPDLAILHISWGITGDHDPDGTLRKPRHGIFTWVATKKAGKWLLLAVHNVNIRETLPTAK